MDTRRIRLCEKVQSREDSVLQAIVRIDGDRRIAPISRPQRANDVAEGWPRDGSGNREHRGYWPAEEPASSRQQQQCDRAGKETDSRRRERSKLLLTTADRIKPNLNGLTHGDLFAR